MRLKSTLGPFLRLQMHVLVETAKTTKYEISNKAAVSPKLDAES